MKTKKDIHFIVNPISGRGKNFLDKIILKSILPKSEYKVHIKPTTSPGHAKKLTLSAIEEQADIIVACGGDGTINEIASCLVGLEIPLGIIPLGSGNGLADNLKIPLELKEAVKTIVYGQIRQIDVGLVNNKYFFSNMGIGFDAALIDHYNQLKERQLKGYLKALIKTMRSFSSVGSITIIKNGKEFYSDPFLLFISNSNKMGYGFSLTPDANIGDGRLDMVLVSKMAKPKLLLFGLLMVARKLSSIKEVNYELINDLQIQGNGKLLQFQIDGELVSTKEEYLNVSLSKDKLKVIVP